MHETDRVWSKSETKQQIITTASLHCKQQKGKKKVEIIIISTYNVCIMFLVKSILHNWKNFPYISVSKEVHFGLNHHFFSSNFLIIIFPMGISILFSILTQKLTMF